MMALAMALADLLPRSAAAEPFGMHRESIRWHGGAILFVHGQLYLPDHLTCQVKTADLHLVAAGHYDALTAVTAPIGGYRTRAEVVSFNLSLWSRASGGYSPRKAAAAVMVDGGDAKKQFRPTPHLFLGGLATEETELR